MPRGFVARLSGLVHYLNISELKAFCVSRNIPYKIYFTQRNGKVIYSGNCDRKGVIVKRLMEYVKTGKIMKPTVYPDGITDFGMASKPTKSRKIFFGQFEKRDEILKLMQHLTDGQFRFGSTAREVLLEQWSNGIAPTYSDFAKLWLKAEKNHRSPNPEWAFLTDRASGMEMTEWKKIRIQKASEALTLLQKLG